MAIRRLNYTGRKRLNHADTRVTIYKSDDGPALFNVDLKLTEYDLPDDAPVFIEAYRQTNWMRFRCGTVTRPVLQEAPILEEFDIPEEILFRVRITSLGEPQGLLLAEAKSIRPRYPEEKEEKRIPLLPVKPDDNLASQIFRIDFADRPIFLINVKVGDWRRVTQEPVFKTLVYPVVLREILTRILHIERYFDTDDSEDWRSQWLRFATLRLGIPDLPDEGDEEKIDDWVDEAVASFCRRYQMMSRFSRFLEGIT